MGWKYYIFYCVGLVAQAGIVWLVFPETYGGTLEEVSFLVEGKGEGGVVDGVGRGEGEENGGRGKVRGRCEA